MKKLLIILTFFFSTIFFTNNVNALGVEVSPYYDFDYGSGATKPSLFTEFPSIKKDVSTLNDKQLANYNNILLAKENNCTNYDSYIITTTTYNGYGYDNNISLLCFNSSNNDYIDPYVAVDYTTYSGNSKYAYLYYYVMLYKSDTVDYYYTAYGTSSGGNSIVVQSGQAQNDNNLYLSIYGYKDVGTTITDRNIVIDTNIDASFKSGDYKIVHTPTLASFMMNDVIYNEGDFGYNDGILYDKSKITTPTVSITKESETTVTIDDETFISSVTLNIEFSSIENDKYFYLYKYGSNSDWSTITLTNSNSFTKTFNINDTLYVQILDKITQETVSSATFTINQINYTFDPYVDITEIIPTACTFYKNGRTYTICKELNISAKNLEDGNFIASYSYNATNWTNFVNTTIPVNENTTIYFQIVNYLTNEVSYHSTYTVANIDTDISELGVFNTYSSTYDKDTSFITAYINIYNLVEPVQDNYKIYYSFNSTSFTDITLLLTDMTNYYQYEINNINENKTIYFKITDLNDNILYTSTYNINYQIQANENSNFFTNFRTNFHGLSDIISTPLYAIKKLNTGVCTPLEIPIPYTDKNISLPCMTTVYQNNMPEILNIWQIVTNGLIAYYIILDLFRIVKSFKEPEEDKIEVVDL